MDNIYNGWTNYETWRVNLELFDGVAWLEDMHDESKSLAEYADALKEYAIECLESEGTTRGLTFDYAMAFLDAVNFVEIARNMISNYEWAQ